MEMGRSGRGRTVDMISWGSRDLDQSSLDLRIRFKEPTRVLGRTKTNRTLPPFFLQKLMVKHVRNGSGVHRARTTIIRVLPSLRR